jgi:hypothetical protein
MASVQMNSARRSRKTTSPSNAGYQLCVKVCHGPRLAEKTVEGFALDRTRQWGLYRRPHEPNLLNRTIKTTHIVYAIQIWRHPDRYLPSLVISSSQAQTKERDGRRGTSSNSVRVAFQPGTMIVQGSQSLPCSTGSNVRKSESITFSPSRAEG